MDENVYITELLDCYRELLTEKQADILSLYYEEDLSLSEITDHYSVTRQAVLDSIKRAVRQLKHYEEKLALVAKVNKHQEIIDNIKLICRELEDKDSAEKILTAVSELEA